MANQRPIYGFHAVNARLWQNPKSIVELYIQEGKSDARTREVLEKAANENIRVYFADADRLNAISKGARHQGVVGFIDASKNHVHLETNLARTLRELKEYGIWIIGTDMGGDADLYHCDLPDSAAWVMGNEGDGMRRLTREHCDMLVSIPMFGTVESMNVSVSAGMVLSETRRQRVLKNEKA